MYSNTIFDLSGKTALITGASGGLGKRFSEILVSAGARVIVTSIQPDELKTLENSLKNAKAIEMDVSNKSEVQKVFSQLEEEGEKIDIIICAAGIGGATPVFESNPLNNNTFERLIQTNLMGIWYVNQYAANHMKKYKIAGSIINISSIRGENYTREERGGYCASKAAVIQLTKTLTGELARAHIRVNCIAPGLFRTALTEYRLNTPALREEAAEPVPLKFAADPSDLDGAILYLASNKASRYVTGSCITVDGGASWGGYAGK